jgi:hypothetical protein
MMEKISDRWRNHEGVRSREFTCGNCDRLVGSNTGYKNEGDSDALIYICPHCAHPTYFMGDRQIPKSLQGKVIDKLPVDIAEVYREIRSSIGNNNYTAAVLLSRKLLMHLAVNVGANEGLKFIAYVDFLNNSGFVPPTSKSWLDKIRSLGNVQNHKISIAAEVDAINMTKFIELLLEFMYEYADPIVVEKTPEEK